LNSLDIPETGFQVVPIATLALLAVDGIAGRFMGKQAMIAGTATKTMIYPEAGRNW
jgi:hypothetical protein